MEFITRKPEFVVSIRRPNYDYVFYSYKNIVDFVSTKSYEVSRPEKGETSTALVSYSFKESLDSVEAGFSLNITLEKDENGKTWLDKIWMMDLVFFTEFDEMRYVGFVESRRYSASMGADGKPQRKILISGRSLGGLLSLFKLVLNQYIYKGNPLALAASAKLNAALAAKQDENKQLAPILKSIYENFFELTLRMGGNYAGVGTKAIIDKFIDYESGLSSKLVTRYPLSLSLYKVGENNIWDLWNQLTNPPIGELFGRWNSDMGKYELIFRQTPFEADDWKGLEINNLPSIIITDYNLGASAQEVFTFYHCSLPGSGISQALSLLLAQDDKTGQLPVIDEQKWKKYGYRPLMLELRYFNTDRLDDFGASALAETLSKMLRDWYKNNDEFYSGQITIMTIDKRMWNGRLKNPKIGEKVKFIDAEFYLEESEHTWSYGSPMINNLTVTRGFRYNNDGTMIGAIDNIGMRLDNLDKYKAEL